MSHPSAVNQNSQKAIPRLTTLFLKMTTLSELNIQQDATICVEVTSTISVYVISFPCCPGLAPQILTCGPPSFPESSVQRKAPKGS